jgi:hypothetical protein
VNGLTELTEEFWAWRVTTTPDSFDDITRVERPAGWFPDWSAEAVAAQRSRVAEFAKRHQEMDLSGAPVAVEVNARLLGSALARVHWELDVVRGWQRNPCFYIDQSLVCFYDLLLAPPPFSAERAATIVSLLRRVPVLLEQARENLAGHAARPFAESALRILGFAGDRLRLGMAALAPVFPDRAGLSEATEIAVAALASYRDWLERELPSFSGPTSVGPEAFAFFLHRVALLPYSAATLRAMGRQEWDRSVAMEAILRRRNRTVPPVFPTAAAQIAHQDADERAVRRFYSDGILSQPTSLRRYLFAPMPAYIAPLTWLGVPHYAGSLSRFGDDALRYVPEPHDGLPYFPLADARDPRVGIAHEGAHAQQLALSWQHPDPARRYYYDSAANEGVAFYNEELMFLSGLYDDAPASAAFVANAMRLRSLRVEIDIALALGDLDIEAAAGLLAEAVPMDRQTAWEEAVFFSGNPGQGMSFQVGKLQILDLLTTAIRQQGDAFDLQAFHDRLWVEGNVPLALQRFELLGLRDHLDEADRLAT